MPAFWQKKRNFEKLFTMKKNILAIILLAPFALSAQTLDEPTVKITTNMGNIVVKLYGKTPQHRDNFIKLVKEKYYDGVLFHRVINQFMIQGGDPDSKTAEPKQVLGNGGPGYTIPFEYVPEYFHKRGVIAAARLGDRENPEKASSGSQFYIVQGRTFTDEELNKIESRTNHEFTAEQRQVYKTVGGTPHLDGSYTVFGEVVSGMDVVDKIARVVTDENDRPVEDVKILSITIVQ